MKLYIFKQIGDARGSYASPILHAFTTDKKLAKDFKETRDMDNFIHHVVEVDETEYNHFARNYSSKNLERVTLRSKNDYGELVKIPIVMTFSEEDQSVLRTDMVYEEMGKHTIYESLSFNDEIRDALSYIDYFKMMKFYNDMDVDPYNISILKAIDMNNTIDEFEVFMFFYGYLMNER